MNKELWINHAKDLGIDEFQIYDTSSKCLSMSLYDDEIDSYTITNDDDYILKAIVSKKVAESHLSSLDDTMMDEVLNNLKANALTIESNDESYLYEGDDNYPKIKVKDNKFRLKTYDEKVKFLKDIAQYCLNLDKRIIQVMSVDYEEVINTVSIINSKGLNVERKNDYGIIAVSLLASEDQDNKSGYKVEFAIDDFDAEEFAKKVVNETISKLNAKSIKSDEYQVIMKNECMRSLLSALSGMFIGENVYKGISIIKDKLNEKIFDERINIIDDGLLDYSFNSVNFDDEGVKSQKTILVQDGILKSYLHNLKSANMMSTKSTGNGFGLGTSSTNLYIDKGDKSFDELVNIMNDGIIIDDISGLHAGLNSLTTKFSLLASGYEVKDGKIVRPINLITVAGTFIDMMKDIKEIGDDLEFSVGGVGSPSILFNKLNISGE